jgi:hypothetical protein
MFASGFFASEPKGYTIDAPRSLMELSTIVAFWCAVMSTLQGVGAYYGLLDRNKRLKTEGQMPSKFNPLLVSIILLLGTFVTIGFGAWMFFAKPLRPTIKTIEKTVYVDKYLPCPPPLPATKTGNASSKGHNSVANTGTIGSLTQGSQKHN